MRMFTTLLMRILNNNCILFKYILAMSEMKAYFASWLYIKGVKKKN